jgi:hypothetical protein
MVSLLQSNRMLPVTTSGINECASDANRHRDRARSKPCLRPGFPFTVDDKVVLPSIIVGKRQVCAEAVVLEPVISPCGLRFQDYAANMVSISPCGKNVLVVVGSLLMGCAALRKAKSQAKQRSDLQLNKTRKENLQVRNRP